MSIDPKINQLILGIQTAIQNSENEDLLNSKIQLLFDNINYESLKKQAATINNSLKGRNLEPIFTTILFDKKIISSETDDLEQKFALLQKTYPGEFAIVLKAVQKEFSLPSVIPTFKQLILELFKSGVKKHQYNFETQINFLEDFNLKEIEKVFMELIFNPVADRVSENFNKEEEVGLRNKPREIQTMFLRGKSQQIASVKQQYLKLESFENIFKDSCSWRSNLSCICLDPDVLLFGQLRTTLEDKTPNTGNLVSGFKTSKAPPELIEKCEALIKEETNVGDDWPFPGSVQTRLSQRTIYGQIDGKQIPLTRLNILGKDDNEFDTIYSNHQEVRWTFPGLMHRHSWTHTGPRYINQCMKHIEDLYQQLLNATSPDQKLNLIARIHWWGCQACPCARGSAAIMEVICQGLLEGADLPYRLNPDKP
ncbi:MAG: hypothetical protein FJZ59_07370, partial [Chlamydiae bacterium]|nr:hypothetical protein [Chlamydiota bacterium]